MFTDNRLLPQQQGWAPCILDGWRGSPTNVQGEDLGRVTYHLLLTVTAGSGRVWLDGQLQRVQPNQVVVAQPGDQVRWELPAGAYLEALCCDMTVRERSRVPGTARLVATDNAPPPRLDTLLSVTVPTLVTGNPGRRLAADIKAIGDSWWRSVGDRLHADARLAAALAALASELTQANASRDDDAWSRIEAWAYLRLEHGVTVADMAKHHGCDRSTFTRNYRVARGHAPGAWLRDQRIQRAQQMLLAGDQSIHAIATACGYRSRWAFDSAFAQVTGLKPSRWQQREREVWQSLPAAHQARPWHETPRRLPPK